MIVTVTEVDPPGGRWATTRTATGVGDDGTVITFAGDHRVMEDLRDLIEEEGEQRVYVEAWQILSSRRPRALPDPSQ